MEPAQTTKEPVLLTTDDVAVMLRVGRDQVKAWRMAGEGPKYIRLGHRTVRYRRSDVDEWVAEKQDREGE